MEKFLIRFINGIFALLGFASCTTGTAPWNEPKDMYGPPVAAEYGVPSATYRFIGKVTGENEEGIPGIRVAVKMSADWTGAYVERDGNMVPYIWEHADTLFTDEKGEFARQYALLEDIESIPKHVQMKVEDVDGEENGGTFATQEGISVDVRQVEEGSGHWNMGTYESQADIKMKKE